MLVGWRAAKKCLFDVRIPEFEAFDLSPEMSAFAAESDISERLKFAQTKPLR